LTSLVLVGLEKGCTTGTCIDKDIKFNAAERSVVWVTPMSETKIFVDYDGDGIVDDVFDVGALESLRLVDTKSNDFDMSGAIIASSTTTKVQTKGLRKASEDCSRLGTRSSPLCHK
jgi:hypothetical protein